MGFFGGMSAPPPPPPPPPPTESSAPTIDEFIEAEVAPVAKRRPQRRRGASIRKTLASLDDVTSNKETILGQ